MNVQEQIEAKLSAALSPELLEVENQSHLHAGHAGSPNSGESHFRVTLKVEALNALSGLSATGKCMPSYRPNSTARCTLCR